MCAHLTDRRLGLRAWMSAVALKAVLPRAPLMVTCTAQPTPVSA